MKQEAKTKEKKKLSKGAIVLIIGLVIIAIPVIVFLTIILSAALKTGKPIVGNRFDGDLNPAITSAQTTQLEKSIEAISGVDDCTIVLTSAQYRINVDTSDSLTSEQIEKLTVDVYNAVNSQLPVNTYFTASGSKKMYDLAINVYNFVDANNENMTYYILTKNSKMEAYSLQCVSEPVDEDLAKELRGETVTPVEEDNENVEE